MVFDLDKAMASLDQLVEWDFTLLIAGMTLKTRRPTVAEVGQLETLGRMTEADAGQLIADLVGGGITREQLLDLGIMSIQAILMSYMTYFRSRTAKIPGRSPARHRQRSQAEESGHSSKRS